MPGQNLPKRAVKVVEEKYIHVHLSETDMHIS